MEVDHKNIEALKFLFLNYPKEALATMKILSICNENIQEFPEAKVMSLFPNVTSLSLAFCSFKAFPCRVIIQTMPLLTKLNLEGCNLDSVKILRPLGELKNLQDLNLSHNPIVIDRISILNSLLFNGKIQPTVDPKKKISRAYSLTKLILAKSQPAKTPRVPPFAMLTVFSNEIITEDEIESIQPKKPKLPNARYTDRILSQVKASNEKILSDKEKYGSMKSLMNTLSLCSGKKPRIDTLQKINSEKKISQYKVTPEHEDLLTDDTSVIEVYEPNPPREPPENIFRSKESIQEFIASNKGLREKALKPIPKKIYTYNEVSTFMYGKIVHETSQVNSVCDVLSIVNGIKNYSGITDIEVYRMLKSNFKSLSFDDVVLFQEILLLDEDMKNMKLKNAYFEWWLHKLEKRHIDYAEHCAILTLHKNRIFNNPLLGAQPPPQSKKVKIFFKENPLATQIMSKNPKRRKLLVEDEQQYATVDFPGMFNEKEVKEGDTIFIAPIVKFENVLESLHNHLKEKERQYEKLSFGDRVLWRLDRIKQNINDREAVRDKLKQLYDQVIKMKKKFLENEVEYFYNIYEKKLNKHEIIKKHDFMQFELPKFVFPLIQDD